jgi:hypothetical protein
MLPVSTAASPNGTHVFLFIRFPFLLLESIYETPRIIGFAVLNAFEESDFGRRVYRGFEPLPQYTF